MKIINEKDYTGNTDGYIEEGCMFCGNNIIIKVNSEENIFILPIGVKTRERIYYDSGPIPILHHEYMCRQCCIKNEKEFNNFNPLLFSREWFREGFREGFREAWALR